MKAKIFFRLLLLILCIGLTFITPLFSQDITILSHNENGSYNIKIGSDTLLAITTAMVKNTLKMKTDLAAAKKEISLKDSIIASYVKVENKYGIFHQQQKEYIKDLATMLDGYKKLANGYKKLAGEPLITFSGGVGVTSADFKPMVLAGLGIKRFRLWSALQERNSGLIAGIAVPLF